MPKLSLALLGPFRAALDGQPISGLTSARARALLAYLVMEADRAHSREELADLFWPDQLRDSSLSSLRQILTQLRRALGDQQTASPFILVTRETLQFDRASSHWLDVAAFRSLLAAGQADVTQLEHALDLYRDEFLAGFPSVRSPEFETWAAFHRADLSRQALVALQQLAAASEMAGDLARAGDYVRHQLAIEPWREEAHRHLMRLLALSGQRSAALAQYEVCRRALKDELDVGPDPATLALCERIRDGEYRPSIPRPAASMIAAQPASTIATQHSGAPSVFVGRERELAWLHGHLEATRAGGGRVALITGEAGSGKTALVAEFIRQAMQEHGDLLAAMGSSNAHTGVGDPYLPFREALEMLASDVEAKRAAESITPEHARRLWALLPETLEALVESGPALINVLVPGHPLLARARGLGPSATHSASLARLEQLIEGRPARPGATLQQTDLFQQVARVLHHLARRHTLVLVLDDLQWADGGSISLLFHLGRRLTAGRILILGAYRPDDVALGRAGQRHPLEPVVAELTRDFGDVLLDLGETEGRRFVDQLLDCEPNRLGEEFRRRLYLRTGGHALFTVELLRGLEERGDLVPDETGRLEEGPSLDWDRLPARVEAVIAERVSRLPKEWQSLLEAASVEGEAFTAEVVARVLALDEREVSRLLSGPLAREHRLVTARSLRRVGGQRLSGYAFRHSPFQQYLYSRLDEVEHAGLHEAVGLALEAFHGPSSGQIAVQLAHHFEAAGLVEKALGYLLQAAKRALHLCAYTEALRHLHRGLSLLPRLPTASERDRWELELQLAAAAPLTMARGWGSPDAARALNRARELSRDLGQTGQLQSVLGLLAFSALGRAQFAEAIGLAEEVLSQGERDGDQMWVSVGHRLLGLAHVFRGAVALGHSHIERALSLRDPQRERSLARPLAPGLLLMCLTSDEIALWKLGYPERSARRGEELLAQARCVADPATARLALTAAAANRVLRREYGAARELAEEVVRLAAGSDDAHLPPWLAVLQGRLQVREGQTEQGLALMRQGVDGWQATGTMPVGPWQLQMLVEACLEAGQIDQGLAALHQAEALAERTGARPFEPEFLRLKGELLRAEGRTRADEAEASLGRAVEVARNLGTKGWELRAATSLARLWAEQGRRREARELLAPVIAWFTEGLESLDLVEARELLDQP